MISSKINALRCTASTARCDATAKKGHVNYDVSDVPVEARAAPTTGRCCYGWVTARHDDGKNRQFFWWERAEAEAQYTPRRRNRRCRACREGSWEEGGGVLLARATASCLVEDTRCHDDGNCIIVASIFDGCGTFFTPRERQAPGFHDVVARASDTPVRLRRQNRDKTLPSWRIQSHRGQL